MTRTIGTVLVAAMLVLAGCAGGLSGGSGGGGDDGTGTMQFYISDEQNAIDDFEHLNATVTKVGLHKVGNESSDGEWVEYDINDTTVDLTELQGENATRIAQMEVPNGTYNKVFVYVDEVNGTLNSGETTDVQLPSSKLHINKNFTVGDGEEIDFVYDMTVVKAGGSGKYVIKPVVSESGTDQEIREVDARTGGQRGQSGDRERGQAGRMEFYLSDEQNAMGDFEHLNVTVTKVGFHKVGENDSESRWVEYDVDNRSVDLTELQGANATKIAEMELPNGTYNKVFVYVGEVDGTLNSGENVNVKLPSSKLHINKQFTVGDGEELDFVYDMSVFKAGNSGKYIIKPVVSESGTDKEIREVGAENEGDEDDESDEDAEPALNATFVGDVAPGENATVKVTSNGTAVENATVTYNGTSYQTDADGTVTFAISEDTEEVEVTATYEDAEAELEREFESDEETDTPESGSSGSQSGTTTTTTTASS